VRAAIGAGRGRMLRQFVVENLLLASAGGMAGLLIARVAVDVDDSTAALAIPRLTETTLDSPLLAFASVASILTAIVCGVAPAANDVAGERAGRTEDGTRTTTAPPRALARTPWTRHPSNWRGISSGRRGAVAGQEPMANHGLSAGL